MSFNLARLPGVAEADVAQTSGLRWHRQVTQHVTSQTENVNARPVGGAASAAVTNWTSLTINSGSVPFCGTLVAHIAQATPTTGTIQLRIRGYDQFGEYIEELAPSVSLTAKTNNYIYLAKVFSWVTEVAYKSTGLDVAGDTLSLGQRWDWTRTVDASNEHHAGRNLGLPIMRRLGISPTAIPESGRRQMEQRVGLGDATRAMQTLVITNTPSNNDWVSIDGKVYTWKTAITSADGDVLIGASAATAMVNLQEAIRASPAAKGVTIGANTTEHPTARLRDFPSGVAANPLRIYVEAKKPGAAGNALVVANLVVAGVTWFSDYYFFGGIDAPREVTGMTVIDLTGIAAAGAITNVTPKQILIGESASGWTGSLEKVHIPRAATVSGWAVTDSVRVDMVIRSADSRR